MSRRTMTSGAVLLSEGQARARIELLGRGLVHVEVSGNLDEEMVTPLLAELDHALGDEAGQIFYDATILEGQSAAFRDAFNRWLGADDGRVQTLHLHCPNALVAMGLAVSGLGERLVVHGDHAAFREAMRGQLSSSGLMALEDDDW